jgi:glycolate oxidase FAD binding subunit
MSGELAAEWAERIRAAAARGAALCLRGGGSKDFYGNAPAGEIFGTTGHAGIVAYEPTELVVTARCGTPLVDLERALAGRGQMLAFEPPHFGENATVGGCVSAGLSGPRRASAGACRDHVLGVRLIDGRGRTLSFGGQVMKNVAGYDVSRLIAGSLGTLGVILEASLKVMPLPERERTIVRAMTQAEAIDALSWLAGQSYPVSASAWVDDALYLRLSGAEHVLAPAAARLGGDALSESEASAFWLDLREQRSRFFMKADRLWRLSIRPTEEPIGLDGSWMLEWHGALRWLRSDAPEAEVRAAARRAGGHATLFRSAAPRTAVFTLPGATELRIMRGVKEALDPAGIFSPGRLFPEL